MFIQGIEVTEDEAQMALDMGLEDFLYEAEDSE